MKGIGRLDPLVLFLAAGLALYLVLDALGLAHGDERSIAVDEAALNAYLASEGGRLPGRRTLADLRMGERRELIERYVREEALYREARALGLDRDDPAIRRRLVQSLRFSLQDDKTGVEEPTEAELRDFFATHRDRYAEPARLSFSHVYFDSSRRGRQEAFAAARQALGRVGYTDWLALGDRYPYQRSQIDVGTDALAAELGQSAARRIAALAPGEAWHGPIESDLGFHLVRIDRKTSGSEPDFAEIRSALAAGLSEERRNQALQRAIDAIVAGYRIRLAPGLEGGSR